MKLIHPVEEATCAPAWVRATSLIMKSPGHTCYNVILGIESPSIVTAEDFRVCDVVDSFLAKHGQDPLSTVANTIFPAGHYLQGGKDGVFDQFPKDYAVFCENWGTYAGRMTTRNVKPTRQSQTLVSPLEMIVTKLRSQLTGSSMRAAYEVGTLNLTDLAEIPLYDATTDCRLVRGGPCLSHLSFKLLPDKSVMLTALYRSHFYIQRALGNLLGLSQLLQFVAEQVETQAGPLVCHSTYAKIDLGEKDSVWSVDDAAQLITQCLTEYGREPLPV